LNQRSSQVPGSRNVSRAIARSRAVRASLARRRRRAVGIAACLAAVVGLPVAWSLAEPAAVVAAAAADKARDLVELLGDRSPGTRTESQLTKHARAASKLRSQPRLAHAPNQLAPDVPSTTELVDLLQPQPTPVEVASEPFSPLAPPPTLGSILASIDHRGTPPGGGGGTSHFPTSEPRELPPTSAVPEPRTWAMMLLGFGLVAWRTRRRGKAQTEAKRASA
jgi:hypothetical protein